MKFGPAIAWIVLIACIVGSTVVMRRCEQQRQAYKQATPAQQYEIGKAAGEAWVQSPLFDNQAAEDVAFTRGFFAGMNSGLAHIDISTNKPHLTLELTNVFADYDRLQKTNSAFIHMLRTNPVALSNLIWGATNK